MAIWKIGRAMENEMKESKSQKDIKG